MRTRYLIGILFVAVAALPFVFMYGTGRDGHGRDDGKAEQLVIISPHRREVRLEYSRGFQAWMMSRRNRNVRITWIDVGGTTKILKELESRFAGSPDAPGADLMFGGGVSPYKIGADRGWLTNVVLSAASLEGIPELCAGSPVYDHDGHWYGVALSGFGILYNRPLIERLGLPVPETWEDLGRPEFCSWISSGDPRSSGSVHMCYEIILQAYGFEKGWGLITRMCANVRQFGESAGVVPREVAAGDVAAGMVIDQYALTMIDSIGRDALKFVLPRDATVIDPDAIGMLRGAPSPDLGTLFIEYAMSEDGQRILCQPAGANGQKYSLHRMPVRRSIYDSPGGPVTCPYDFETSFRFDGAKEAQRREIVNDLIGVVLIDGHARLLEAWRRATSPGADADLVARLCAPPVTESELAVLAGEWNDPRRRTEVIRKWAEEATERYRSVL